MLEQLVLPAQDPHPTLQFLHLNTKDAQHETTTNGYLGSIFLVVNVQYRYLSLSVTPFNESKDFKEILSSVLDPDPVGPVII